MEFKWLSRIKVYSENSSGVPVYYSVDRGKMEDFEYILTQPIKKIVIPVERKTETGRISEEIEVTIDQSIEHIKNQQLNLK